MGRFWVQPLLPKINEQKDPEWILIVERPRWRLNSSCLDRCVKNSADVSLMAGVLTNFNLDV